MISKTISHYKIFYEIGAGGMGVVYKAEDTKLKRTVALKFLPPELLRDKEAKERFTQEAQAAASLNHNNICTIHEIDEHDGSTFIAMEYIEGVSLKDKIAERPLKLEEALEIVKQIAAGLQKAHEKGIIHRDIKPANILISSDGVAKIVDFGLAKLSGQTKLTKDGSTLGTVAYMSPEQTQGVNVDHRTDIWSVGIVLYEMLSGYLPFKGDYEQAIVYSILNEEPEQLNDVVIGLDEIVNKTLTKNPDERYQHVDEMMVDLRNMKNVLTEPSEIQKKRPKESNKTKKRFKHIFIPTVIVLFLIFAFFLIRPYFSEEITITNPKTVAILPFENLSNDDELNILKISVPQIFISKLIESKYLKVTSWERMRDVFKQIGGKAEELININQDTGFEICKRDRIETVITGNVTKMGDIYSLDVKVLDVETKDILASNVQRGEGQKSIFEQIDIIAPDIAKEIGLSENKVSTLNKPVSENTSRSIEAYNCYIEGKEKAINYQWPEALSLMQKAVKIDTTFASAYLKLARYSIMPFRDSRAASEAIKNARKYSHKTSRHDSLFIEKYYAEIVENDSRKNFNLLIQIANEFPKEKEAHKLLVTIYTYSRKYNLAIEESKKVIEIDPSYAEIWNGLAFAYVGKGNFDKAIESINKYKEMVPNSWNPIDSRGDIYFQMGKLDNALEDYNKMIIHPNWIVGLENKIGYFCAMEERYDETLQWIEKSLHPSSPYIHHGVYFYKAFIYAWLGDFSNSLQVIKNGEDYAKKADNQLGLTRAQQLRGWICFYLGQYEQSGKHFKNWFNYYNLNQPDQLEYKAEYLFSVGFINAEKGQIEFANEMLKEMENLLPEIKLDRIKTLFNYLSAKIAYKQGAYQKVIDILLKSQPYKLATPYAYNILPHNFPFIKELLAQAYIQNSEIEKAIEEYIKLTTYYKNDNTQFFKHPTYHYRLAKLYEEKGEKQKAIERYEKFIDIWKNADDDLPEKIDAEKRLANLEEANK